MVDPYDVFYYPLADSEFPYWVVQKAKLMFPELTDSMAIQKDIVYRKINELNSFAGSNVLVVGGGPSTNNLEIDDFLSYDFIFSMNSCFKHKISLFLPLLAVIFLLSVVKLEIIAYLFHIIIFMQFLKYPFKLIYIPFNNSCI